MKKEIEFNKIPEFKILFIVLFIQAFLLLITNDELATSIFDWISLAYVMYILVMIKIKKNYSSLRTVVVFPLITSTQIYVSIGSTGDVANAISMLIFTLFRIIIPTVIIVMDEMIGSAK